MPYANNKGADQPARPRTRRLISAFVVRCLVSIIPLVSITEISSHYLASVAAQAGLSLPWSQTPKTGFLVARLKFISLWGIALVCSGRATLITRERTNKPRLYRRYEPRHEKTCLRGFRSGKTQSGLRSQRSYLKP